MAGVKLHSESGGCRVYSLDADGFPRKSYIICSDASRKILYRPYLAGKELQDAMDDVGEVFVRAASRIALKGTEKGNLVELVYLAGGLFYGINEGFKRVLDFAIPQCFIGIRRVKVHGSEGDFTAEIGYENFEAFPDNATVIIGDTMATGATMANGIASLGKTLEKSGKRIEKLIVFTLAGAPRAAKMLETASRGLKKTNPGMETYFFACEQMFALMPDGTDLRFLEAGAIMPDETKEYTLRTYGQWLGKNMKCGVFDWGTRCKNPKKHYLEFVEYAEKAMKGAPKDARERLGAMKTEAEGRLSAFSERI